MANYSGPVCRFCRREGAKLYLKGERCYTPKCAIERRAFAPGMHGQARKRKTSDYGIQLRAKQKARRIYGLLEKQFRNYFNAAAKEPGVTGVNLLRHLELRLDNVIYRLGLGTSRKQARQLVAHRHFEVNGKTVNVPSYQLKVGDVLKVKPANGVIDVALESSKVRPVPAWLSFSADDKSAKVLARPERHEMETGVEEQVVAGDRVAVENVCDGVADIDHHHPQATMFFVGTGAALIGIFRCAADWGKPTVHQSDDCTDPDLICWLGEKVTARFPPFGIHDSGLTKFIENALDEFNWQPVHLCEIDG